MSIDKWSLECQRLLIPCRGATSESSYSLGSIETFHCYRCSVNIAVIELVDLSLYGGKLVGNFGGK